VDAVEQLRDKVISDLFKTATFNKAWEAWFPKISATLGSEFKNANILKLGESLSEIFKSTSDGRDQSQVSGGGAAWEALVCWYLNLCLIGSKTVIVKSKKANIPNCVRETISVIYNGNFKSNTESDLLAITFPEHECLKSKFTTHKMLLEKMNEVIESSFKETELTIIQCKTNWNDNAQIPMLWDLIYSSNGFSQNVHVGAGPFSPKLLKKFTYAFVTVPTSRGSFEPNSTPVMRVRNLSGGNYWGKKTKSGVANSVFDIIQRNFKNSFDNYPNGWHLDISALIKAKRSNGNPFSL
jgi:hypothetical protein